MPSIRSMLLFAAAAAAADVTTTLWMPVDDYYYSYGDEFMEKNITASVIEKSGDSLTMAIAPTATYESTLASTRVRTYTQTYHTTSATWIGADRFKYQTVYVGYSADTTYAAECSMETASFKAVCTETTTAADLYQDYCDYYTSYTRNTEPYPTTKRVTYDTITVTQVSTYTPYPRSTPSVCLSGSTLPESYYKRTSTYRAQPYQVVVTGAAEKLSATGAASSGSGTASGTASGSGSQQSGTNAPPSGNAAHPMVTAAPALAGLGVAAAAIFL